MNNPLDLLAQSIANEACHLLEQSCIKIQHCLDQLEEHHVWAKVSNSPNSIGNLMLHLSGNLNQWAVSGIGPGIDNRDREIEFSTQGGLTKAELTQSLNSTVAEAVKVIQGCATERWLAPLNVQGFHVTAHAAVSHTSSHFVGHTHQIILLTRIQLGDQYKFHWSPNSDRDKLPI